MKATAIAPTNIAFTKYWGKKDEMLRLPENGSVSMCLSDLLTTTTVEFSPEFKKDGDIIYLLGETNDEQGVPKVNLEKNLKTYLALEKTIQKELVASSISVTSGGLAIAVAKACVGDMLGCNISTQIAPKALSVDAKLFSESQGRILVSVAPKNIKQFEKIMKGISFTKLGKVEKSGKIIITDGSLKLIDTNVKKLHKIYHSFSEKMRKHI